MLAQWLRRFIGNARGNVAVIFALTAVPVTFLVGMGIDYGQAAMRYDQLSSAADAAALAAVTTAMMASNDAASTQAATTTFNAQASAITGITYNPANVKVTVADSITNRTVTVSYTAQSTNLFPSILGSSTIAISGQSQAVGQAAPNMDFYLLLDSSPSMAIAATQAGITTMVNNTQSQSGCAFACHQSNPAKDNLGNPSNVACTGAGYANPSFPTGGEDNYALARCLSVTLRIDNLNAAAQNLMTTAQQSETTNNATYRMAIYSFDVNFNTLGSLTSNLTSAQTEASNLSMLEVYSNNNLTSSNNNDDEDTNYDNAMSNINSTMPNPGNGTNAQGDKPQEVLFFVTDGVEDENVNGGRQQSVMDPGWCTTIKNRGIRIAVLYTTYYPLPTNSWYNTYISPIQANIGTTLQSCASPGLYYEVSTGGDISAALSSLFQIAVATAHLSQ
jgi:Flp pilus assembly protein TadG